MSVFQKYQIKNTKKNQIRGFGFRSVGLVFSKSNLVFFRQFGIFPSILVFFKFIWYGGKWERTLGVVRLRREHNSERKQS